MRSACVVERKEVNVKHQTAPNISLAALTLVNGWSFDSMLQEVDMETESNGVLD